MSEKKLISTGSPFEETIGFSRAVAQGPWCFVSGVTGYDYRTMEMPEDVGEQTRNCFNSIQAALTEAGFFMSDIVRVQYTITDATLFDQITPITGEVLGDIRPAATMVVADLIKSEMKVEIEVTAFRG